MSGASESSAAGPAPAAATPPGGRTCGARFSVRDGVAVAVAAAATSALGDLPAEVRWIRWLPAVALGHFFLFCNVFRVRTRYELAWTAAFLANFTGWFLAGSFSWLGVLALQAPVTALAIGLEMRSASYHGLACRRINPHLDAYLRGESPD